MSKARHKLGAAYGAFGFLTLVFQLIVRLQQCVLFSACAASAGKASIWSLIWPAYWMLYLHVIRGEDTFLSLVLVGIVVPYAFVMLYILSFLLRSFQWLADGMLRIWAGRRLSALLAAGFSAGLMMTAIYAALRGLDIHGPAGWRILGALWAINALLMEVDLYGRVEGFRRSLWRD